MTTMPAAVAIKPLPRVFAWARRHLFRTPLDAFVTIENAFDRRYRSINPYAYTNTQELIGAPQNPRRVSIGFSLRLE